MVPSSAIETPSMAKITSIFSNFDPVEPNGSGLFTKMPVYFKKKTKKERKKPQNWRENTSSVSRKKKNERKKRKERENSELVRGSCPTRLSSIDSLLIGMQFQSRRIHCSRHAVGYLSGNV
jgi:hypothetical protein